MTTVNVRNRNTGASLPTKEEDKFNGPFNYFGADHRNELKRVKKNGKTRLVLSVVNTDSTVLAQGEAVKVEEDQYKKSMESIPRTKEERKGSGQPPAYRLTLKDQKDKDKTLELAGWPAYQPEHDTFYIQWRPNVSFEPITMEKFKEFLS